MLSATCFLRCSRLSRFFGDFAALRQVELACPAGTLTALWGANGAGKSTLLRILAGGLRPSEGEAWIGDAAAGTAAARRQTGLLWHASLLQPALTVAENLRFYARLYGLSAAAAERALAEVGGELLGARRVGELSQGMRQKAALARCLVHAPKLLLLDEPFASLDSASVGELQATLARLREGGTTILASSHQAEPLRALADAELTLERGRLSAGAASHA